MFYNAVKVRDQVELIYVSPPTSTDSRDGLPPHPPPPLAPPAPLAPPLQPHESFLNAVNNK